VCGTALVLLQLFDVLEARLVATMLQLESSERKGDKMASHAKRAILETLDVRETRNGRKRAFLTIEVDIPADGLGGNSHVNRSPHGNVSGIISDIAAALSTLEYRFRHPDADASAE
jgi:hypothetical protein